MMRAARKPIEFGRRQFHTIICREIIKPSSPTPSLLSTYNLSELDQMVPHTPIPLVLFYPHDHVSCTLTVNDKATVLKQSLSQSLTKYYPFAGRYPTPINPVYVDCNDEGVVVVEAKHNDHMSTFQRVISSEDDTSTMAQLFSDNLIGHYYPQNTNVFGVQLNHFACGGIMVAVSLSHLIGDACTFYSFINHWACVARYGSTDHEEVVKNNPHYLQSPRTNYTILRELLSEISNNGCPNWVTRRFVFPNSKLSDLKNQVAVVAGSDQPITNPTRVEVLTSVLYKKALAAAAKHSGCFQPSSLTTLVDFRSKFDQKLPTTTVGNFVSSMVVPTRCTSETSLNYLVSEIKKHKSQFGGFQSMQDAVENLISLFSKQKIEGELTKRLYMCSSLCSFPFEKVDFGWGKPTGAIMQLSKVADTPAFMLMNTPDGDAIEAAVILDKEEMEIFENDKEMLSFCQTS